MLFADLQTWLRALLQYFDQGGVVMVPLAACTLLLWYSLAYRAMTLRRGRVRSVGGLIADARRGNNRRGLGIIDTAVIRGMEIVARRPKHLRGHLDAAFFDLKAEMKRFSVLSQAVVVVAPLAGLFGTVTGMIETFDALGDRSLFSTSGGIAGGISQALISTQMGLAVAIPGLVVGRILKRRQLTLENGLNEVTDALCLESARQQESAA